MALKGNCDNSGTSLPRWSPHWHPLITVLAIKRRGRAAIGACSRPLANCTVFPHLVRLRLGLMGCEKTIIPSIYSITRIHYGHTIIDNRLKIMSLDEIAPYAVFIFSRRPSTVV